MKKRIKRALISVSDKSKLQSILKILKKFNIEVISSGGSYKSIKRLGYKCIELSNYTGFNEMLGGRVKTLHPKIHSGILFDRKNKKHLKEMKKEKFLAIDLVIVNFYPFEKKIAETKVPHKIIENIDIGGPSMVRAAAKNFKDVAVITNTDDYRILIKELVKNKGSTTLSFR